MSDESDVTTHALRELSAGARHVITRVDTDDPDCSTWSGIAAVIYYGRGWCFPCGPKWLAREQPRKGDTLVMGDDLHWRVDHA